MPIKYRKEILLNKLSREFAEEIGISKFYNGFDVLPGTDTSRHNYNQGNIRESILCFLYNFMGACSLNLSFTELKNAMQIYTHNIQIAIETNNLDYNNKTRINNTEKYFLNLFRLEVRKTVEVIGSKKGKKTKVIKARDAFSWASLLYNLILTKCLPPDLKGLLVRAYIGENGMVHTVAAYPYENKGMRIKWVLVKFEDLMDFREYLKEETSQMEKNITKYEADYNRAMRLMGQERFAEAKSILNNIIKTGEIFPFTSGCYVSLASIMINEDTDRTLLEQKKDIESLLYKALEIKPSNAVGPAIFVQLNVLLSDFKSANFWIKKCQQEKTLIELNGLLEKYFKHAQIALYSNQNFAEKVNTKEAVSFFNEVLKLYPEDYFIHLIVAKIFSMSENDGLLRAYDICKELIKRWPNIPEAYITISSLCGVGFLNRPHEQKEYAEKALELLENDQKNISRDNIKDIKDGIRAAEGHLIDAYLQLDECDKALALTSKRLDENPNNTDFHNHALALFSLKRYEESIKYCQRALYIGEDETTYFLLGENYYYLKDYKKALEQYRKSLSFLDEDKRSISYVEENKEVLFSYAKKEWFEQKEEKIYVPMIDCYFKLDDLVSAKAIWEIANKRYPNNKAVSVWENIIDKLIDARNEKEHVSKRYQQILNELEDEKRKTARKKNVVRSWAVELMKIQGIEEKIGEWQWEEFEEKIDLIIKKMMKESKGSAKFYDFKNKLRNTFPKFDEKSIEFLSTAEYLYEINKDSYIDFAPIMVEYCKVIELELRILLGYKDRTLGQSIKLIEEKGINPLFNHIYTLNEIYQYRNGSAHVGLSTQEKVKKVREIYFQKDLLSVIHSLKNK